MCSISAVENKQTTNPTNTQEELYTLLRQLGFKENSRSLQEYERTKKCILHDGEWCGKNYHIVHFWISDYIGV